MAFWGVEVKPGKPFTHAFDNIKGRLRISQATLGIGDASKRCLVQCNVGNKSPVFLCSLLPDKIESCNLDLEFEEEDEILFSVIGPRSVHLTGYYVRNSRHSTMNDESESFGEDVGHSGSEESNRLSEEDEYEDSFINDSDPESLPPSPLSNDEVESQDTLEDRKPKNKKGRKNLKKKIKMSESEASAPPTFFGKRRNGRNIIESDDEDSKPISFLCKSRNTSPDTKLEEGKQATTEKKEEDNGKLAAESIMRDEAAAVDCKPERESGQPMEISTEVANPETEVKPKKKRKQRSKDKSAPDKGGLSNIIAVETKHDEVPYKIGQSLPSENQQKEASNDKPMKKRKKKIEEEKAIEAGNVLHSHVMKEEDGHEKGSDTAKICQDHQSVPDLKPNSDKASNSDDDKNASEKPSEEKKKKKKRRTKALENDENLNTNVPLLSTKEVGGSMMDTEGENSHVNISQTRMLSNGLTIEELEMGKPEGKVASKGKKVSVRYVAKLKKNGHVFQSNMEGAPLKFRLGAGKVIQGLDEGLDGMRVGGKRRLTIPPPLGYESAADNENIPPNSWLVYDVELVTAS